MLKQAMSGDNFTAADESTPPPVLTRMRIEYYRLIPNERFVLDEENLYTKGLTDALKRIGWIEDDSPKWVDGPHIKQMLAPDKKYWTVIKLSIAEEKFKVQKWSSPLSTKPVASTKPATRKTGRHNLPVSDFPAAPNAKNAVASGAPEGLPSHRDLPRPRSRKTATLPK